MSQGSKSSCHIKSLCDFNPPLFYENKHKQTNKTTRPTRKDEPPPLRLQDHSQVMQDAKVEEQVGEKQIGTEQEQEQHRQ